MTTYKAPTDLDRQALRAMGHSIPHAPIVHCAHDGSWNPCEYPVCNCQQPEAAEAATDIGADDERQPLTLLETVKLWAGTLAPIGLVLCVAALAVLLPS